MSKAIRVLLAGLAVLGMVPCVAIAQQKPRVLDDFGDSSKWRVNTSNQVSASVRLVQGTDGKALCIDYDFNGVSGYAGIQRDLPLDFPDNYRFDFRIRGESPRNDLQFKLIDASGDNVWWVNRPKYAFPAEWTPVTYKRRHIDKAWGPGADPVLRHSAKLEYTLYNNAGGKGSVCLDQLTLTTLPPQDDSPLVARAKASTQADGSKAEFAVDGDPATAWRAGFQTSPDPALVLDLGSRREFGGLVLQWSADEYASAYRIELSDDGKQWREVRSVAHGNGGTDFIALPESESRYLRVLPESGLGLGFGLAEVEVKPIGFANTPNDFLKSVAKESPRGWFPRGFSGEQPYWTLVGIDGGFEQGLISEDGAIEIGKGAPSVEPLVYVRDSDPARGKLVAWSDVESVQSLQEGHLPIPQVEWKHADFRMQITSFVQGTPGASQLVARYRLTNASARTREYVLALAVQPWQVNPPCQFLNTTGGYSPIRELRMVDGVAYLDGKPRVYLQHPGTELATAFDGGTIAERLASGNFFISGMAPQTNAVSDSEGLASGAFLYPVTLKPGESTEVAWIAPLDGTYTRNTPFDAAKSQAQVAAVWRQKLDGLSLDVPPAGQAVADTLRTATAHMLISRIGPRLQPGTRSYARSWIRDGAMISEGLLRMGRPEVVKDYVEFFAPYQFKDGMVPCCVDDRGSDPVPENDSHGELIYNIAELYRYTGDKAMLQAMWPHVLGAYQYMENLRLSERTEANRAKNAAFYGMMPVSISHEGYSAKPVHSYWDNFWALRGYKDAVDVATWLGKAQDAERFAASRDQFQQDLMDSLQAAVKFHGIGFLPGSAELGDFDATSTTIGLAPGGEQGRLPDALLRATFERYWTEFDQRAKGQREWKDYTPYEWRNVSAFVRLGWRERAWDAVQFFFKDRAPQAWNQWAEVVSRTPRKPFFVGDLPHAWVASDFVRSALDMFAYTREIDDSIVLAAGVPTAWFDGKGVALDGLRTPHGNLGYSLRRVDGQLRLRIDKDVGLPGGGLVFPWPYDGEPGRATLNGKPIAWKERELRIQSLPADVRIEAK